MPFEHWIWLTVTIVRILLPFTIPRWPLAGAILCIIADTHDHTVFRATGFGPLGGGSYQEWDKLLDTWYLTMLLVVSREWTQALARKTVAWLYAWRLTGVLLFALTHWRPILVFTPNVVEYFYLFWVVSLKWFPFRLTGRRLLFILLPLVLTKAYQEIMMHWLYPDQGIIPAPWELLERK